jgi:F-type H+-transporting ATPase subunit delta
MASKTNIKELSRRYASALLELAESKKKLSKVEADLEEVADLLAKSETFRNSLTSPIITIGEQQAVFGEIAKKSKLDALTLNFLKVMAKNRRLGNLSETISTFKDMIAEKNNEVTAEIISAEELDKATIAKLEKEFSTKTGKTVHANVTVNEAILGGLIVRIGAKMYDYSVKTRLENLKRELQAAS